MDDSIRCAAPFAIGFTNSRSGFRNCCSASPQVNSKPGQTFEDWWNSQELNEFRQQFGKTEFPDACYRCRINEQNNSSSYRTAVNNQYGTHTAIKALPQSWNVMFGSVCNLGCWICNEKSSTVIENHKQKLGLLPANYVSSQQLFMQQWPNLQSSILSSYDYHSDISITILGGEPLYNKTVIDFLTLLIERGLSTRTKLEFQTNATVFTPAIQRLLAKGQWQYVTILMSLDAVGAKAEWLRYGCSWDTVIRNIPLFRNAADYLQINATVSILSIMDVPDLVSFAAQQSIPLVASVVAEPDFLRLERWPGNPKDIADPDSLASAGYAEFYALIGTEPDQQAPKKIQQYIQSFDSIRKPLRNFDPKSAKIFGVD